MSLKPLPKIQCKAPVDSIRWDISADAMTRWDASISARSDDTTITIYDYIGDDGWSDSGVTAKRISAALRSIGEREVTVSINSPGGDFFEGLAIYNLLREHPHKVTVKVVGLAASAASIIAMAGDEIQVAKSGFLMIHNAWAYVAGNKKAMLGAADILDGFDKSMADIYATVTDEDIKKISEMMDSETWMTGQGAVDHGFATGLLPSDEVVEGDGDRGAVAAVRKIDNILAKQGMRRAERKDLLNQIKGGTPGAAATVMPGADLLVEIANRVEKSINEATHERRTKRIN